MEVWRTYFNAHIKGLEDDDYEKIMGFSQLIEWRIWLKSVKAI
jgi:hypothetical protein